MKTENDNPEPRLVRVTITDTEGVLLDCDEIELLEGHRYIHIRASKYAHSPESKVVLDAGLVS